MEMKKNEDRYTALAQEEPWVGVDLDATLARYDGWDGDITKIGAPVPAMVKRVKHWLNCGIKVKIFTARVSNHKDDYYLNLAVGSIQLWCKKHLGVILPITNVKDYSMLQLWDDRCVQVIPNTGKTLADVIIEAQSPYGLPKPEDEV